MQLLSQKYRHEATGITFKILFTPWKITSMLGSTVTTNKKSVRVDSNSGKGTFTFNMSKPEMLIKIGRTLQEIGEFVKSL